MNINIKKLKNDKELLLAAIGDNDNLKPLLDYFTSFENQISELNGRQPFDSIDSNDTFNLSLSNKIGGFTKDDFRHHLKDVEVILSDDDLDDLFDFSKKNYTPWDGMNWGVIQKNYNLWKFTKERAI